MSSDGYFDGDDDFDASALEQLDAIEAAHFSPGKQTTQPSPPPISQNKRPAPLAKESSFYDVSFDMEETDLAQLDNFIEDAYQGKAKPIAGPSKIFRTSSSNTLQTTLFGEVLQPTASSSSKPKSQIQRTKSVARNPFGQQALKTKQWDQTAFAKSGMKQGKLKGKGKSKAGNGEDESDEETVEFEQFPAPFVSIGPPPPMKSAPDLLEAKHWIFPINRSKRDYQFNIVKNSLFENTLVALPTGLGKTFIAGVVMLNYYRWFPEGKVVFVAPTKPLVAQQVNACHETCGIPGGDSIELTGEVARPMRVKYWKEKRVFFMTPQTLVNDLLKETCDVRDIVLLVVDEAHRATGDYAYNQVIRFLMAKNPHFRVLALTATPGNSTDAVQTLIDGLHISRIEIRNEESLDLTPYIHKKTFKPHIIKANENVAKIRNLIINVMMPLMKPMQQAGVLRPNESAVSMHPYRPQVIMGELKEPHKRFFSSLSMLSKLARAMLYLLTGSIGSCYTYLQEASNDQPADGDSGKKKVPKGKKLKDDSNFRALMQELDMQRARGFDIHPKVEKLKSILIQHFGSRISDEGGEDRESDPDNTRVMVFSSYRAVVDEIVEELGKERPLIRPARFIGQGTDKQGKKGLAQKEQLDVIKKFMAGEYNVLVATSIGEEGLDIGEIDITVCYDADKAPTRMIQRFGRTGRKRAGTIHALLAEDREEYNIEQAEATYKEVQKIISKGELYELYGDVERLIPDHIKPECVEKVVEIQEYVREDGRKKGSAKQKGPSTQGAKRKRNDDVERNIPDGASSGFVSVRDLVIKGAKKHKKVALSKDFEACGEDDETDEDIASGRVFALPRRTQSAAAGPSKEKRSEKGKLRKSATINEGKTIKAKRKKKLEEPTPSQFSKQGQDDSDDMDIEQGAVLPRTQRKDVLSPIPEPSDEMDIDDETVLTNIQTPQAHLSTARESSLKRKLDEPVIELSVSEHDRPSPTISKHRLPSPPRNDSPHNKPLDDDQNMGWLVDDDDDNFDFEIVDSSPIAPKQALPLERMQVGDESIEISRPTSNNHFAEPWAPSDTSVDDSVEFVELSDVAAPSSERKLGKMQSKSTLEVLSPDLSPLKDTDTLKSSSSLSRLPLTPPKTTYSPTWPQSSSPLYPAVEKPNMSMPPPALPRRLLSSPAATGYSMPEPSFPVRPVGNQAKRRRIIFDDESPALDMPPPSQRRLHRIESTPVRPKAKQKPKLAKPSLLDRNVNTVFDGEAAHSGDESSEGHSSEDEESESDRLFLKDSPATQVSQSYEQTQIYRRSLMTQAGENGDGPTFANRPNRRRPFGRIDGPRVQYDLPSSSPPPPDDDLDHYHLGSFVVDDYEEISYAIDE